MTKNKLPFTGERCVPENMSGQIKTYQHHIARYNFALMYARKKKVLDAACGSGFGVNLFYDVADYVMGMDISDEAIEYAREKYNGYFVIGDLNEQTRDTQGFRSFSKWRVLHGQRVGRQAHTWACA